MGGFAIHYFFLINRDVSENLIPQTTLIHLAAPRGKYGVVFFDAELIYTVSARRKSIGLGSPPQLAQQTF